MILFYKTTNNIYAYAFSCLWYKRVTLGKKIEELTDVERAAAIFHEVGHVEQHHTEWRVICLLFAPFLLKWLCRKQELDADRYAAQYGHAQGLLSLLANEWDGNFFQPSHALRRASLERQDHSRPVPVTG